MTRLAPLSCTVPESPGPVCRMTVAGDLDMDGVPALLEAVDDALRRPCRHLLMDLTDLAFCDSTGITALVRGFDHARAEGVGMVFAGLRDNVAKVFELTGLDGVLTVYPTPETALSVLAA